jgi:hypothetical protein
LHKALDESGSAKAIKIKDYSGIMAFHASIATLDELIRRKNKRNPAVPSKKSSQRPEWFVEHAQVFLRHWMQWLRMTASGVSRPDIQSTMTRICPGMEGLLK